MAKSSLRRYLDTTAQVSNEVFDARLKLIMRNFVYGSREMPNQLQDLILWIDMQGLEVWRPKSASNPHSSTTSGALKDSLGIS